MDDGNRRSGTNEKNDSSAQESNEGMDQDVFERDIKDNDIKDKRKQWMFNRKSAYLLPVSKEEKYSSDSSRNPREDGGHRLDTRQVACGHARSGSATNGSRSVGESSSDRNSLADNQIFAEVSEDQEDFLTDGTPSKVMKESVLSYKRDTKNFFVGSLLGNCSRRARRCDDRWYAWTKDMMESIDKNEAVMTKFLLSEGHSKLGCLMEKGCSSWNLTIEDNVRDLIDGLRSIENMIRSDRGMRTIWGRIKYRGVFKNNVRHYLSKVKCGAAKKFDLVDYAKHRGKKWDDHFEKMRSREEQEDLYG